MSDREATPGLWILLDEHLRRMLFRAQRGEPVDVILLEEYASMKQYVVDVGEEEGQ